MYSYRPIIGRPICHGLDNGSRQAQSMMLGRLSHGLFRPWGPTLLGAHSGYLSNALGDVAIEQDPASVASPKD